MKRRKSGVMRATVVAVALLSGVVSAGGGALLETFKLLAPGGAAGDAAGTAVAVEGTTVLVGAPADDEVVTNAGAVHVFDASTGAAVAKLLAGDGAQGDSFGGAVAVSGGTAIVGASGADAAGTNSGAAYLFSVATATELDKLTALDGAAQDFFGSSVDVDAGTAVVGAPRDDDNGSFSGSAYLFDTATGSQTWKLVASDGAAGDAFGTAVAVAGNLAVVGAPFRDARGTDSGAAYLFDATTGQEIRTLLPVGGAAFDEFGTSVAIHGTTVLVGSPRDQGSIQGAAYLFDALTGVQTAKLAGFGAAGTAWFGTSVALDDATALVGARSATPILGTSSATGAAFAFDAATGEPLAGFWAGDGAAGDDLGSSVAVDGPVAAAGAPRNDEGGNDAGAAYLFDVVCAPGPYCTAKTSSAGCVATVQSPPGPPVSGANDYEVIAFDVQELKNGLLFAGVDGPANLPFSGGVLCVLPPLKRGPVMSSGGADPFGCVGRFSTVVNDGAVVPAGLDAGPGNSGWYQYWYRDPDNGPGQLGTALSNATQLDFQ